MPNQMLFLNQMLKQNFKLLAFGWWQIILMVAGIFQ
jgi:hypothetical protein